VAILLLLFGQVMFFEEGKLSFHPMENSSGGATFFVENMRKLQISLDRITLKHELLHGFMCRFPV